jgi:hypothetical protein
MNLKLIMKTKNKFIWIYLNKSCLKYNKIKKEIYFNMMEINILNHVKN